MGPDYFRKIKQHLNRFSSFKVAPIPDLDVTSYFKTCRHELGADEERTNFNISIFSVFVFSISY